MKPHVCSLGIPFLLLATVSAAAQTSSAVRHVHADPRITDSAIVAFTTSARAATARYRDAAVALRDGFRPIGVETPAMGQHWVNTGRVFSGQFDAARPSGLQYVMIAGRPTLVGVAYIVPLLAGEHPPAFPDSLRWHTHAGTVEEETLLADHDAASRAGGARVAVLHAWVWADNPTGVFAPDNWGLPYLRAGLRQPSTARPAIARVIALAASGPGHFTSIIQRYGLPSANDSVRIVSLTADASSAARAVLAAVDSDSLRAADASRLEAIWDDLWQRIDSGVDPQVRVRLNPVRAAMVSPPE